MKELTDLIVESSNAQAAAASAALRTGTVTDTTTGRVDVELVGGTVLSGVRIIESYSDPQPGDLVVIAAMQNGQWLVLGSMAPLTPPSLLTYDLHEPSLISTYYDGAYGGSMFFPPAQGSSAGVTYSTVINYGESLVPAGTIRSATIIMARHRVDVDGWGPVQVMLTAHAHTSPPNPGPPTFTHGPTAVGTLSTDAPTNFDIPSAWWPAIENGSIKGFGLHSSSPTHFLTLSANDSGRVIIGYEP